MKSFALLLLTLTLVAACTPAEKPPRGSELANSLSAPDSGKSEWAVSLKGIGFVQTGMTIPILNGALNQPVVAPDSANRACAYVTPSELPPGVTLMIANGAVVRVDVDAENVLTEEGVGVGDPETTVARLYAGRIRIEPHKYTGPVGHYLIVTAPNDTEHQIVFETDGEKVLRYRAGQRAAVELVERCG